MGVGPVGGSASTMEQASVSMVKKSQDLEKIEGEANVKLIEGSAAAQQPQPPAAPAPGQPGSVLSVYA